MQMPATIMDRFIIKDTTFLLVPPRHLGTTNRSDIKTKDFCMAILNFMVHF